MLFMGILGKKSIADPAMPQIRGRRVDRNTVARIRQRAEKFGEDFDNTNKYPIRVEIAERAQQHFEQQMALLRHEAVQARRLAEQVEGLSRQTPKRTGNPTMTESPIFSPGHNQRPKPTMSNRPTARRGALAFNPLHPSMELPPEQLIRLLSMESKKTRKHVKMRRPSGQQTSRRAMSGQKTQRSPDQQNTRQAADAEKSQISPDQQKSQHVAEEQKTRCSPSQQQPEPRPVARQSHRMEYERNEPVVFDRRRRGWLLPALAGGLVTGIAVSGYLFRHPPSPAAKQKTPAAAVSSMPRKQQPQHQPLKRKAVPASVETATLPAQAPATAKAAGTGNDATWQAAVQTEQDRARRAAEQRLAERLIKLEVYRELADRQTPPANVHTPAAAALPAPAAPAFEQTAVPEPEPAPAGTESPLVQDEAKPVPEPATLPTLAPTQFDESTGPVGSFEQDTVSEIVPADEENPVSDPAHTTEQDSVPDATASSTQEMQTEQSASDVSDDSPLSATEDSGSF